MTVCPDCNVRRRDYAMAALRRLRPFTAASTFAVSASTPRRSVGGGPGLVEEGYIVSHQVEDF